MCTTSGSAVHFDVEVILMAYAPTPPRSDVLPRQTLPQRLAAEVFHDRLGEAAPDHLAGGWAAAGCGHPLLLHALLDDLRERASVGEPAQVADAQQRCESSPRGRR
ncbi:hypothetical protein [Streptomyces sp. NPDC046385]|uniref:hypothetical protein n=1 Tax=Streptomyces sp. NPDC046385 TaxID=3154918 RepID=UPI0033EF5011